MSNTKEHMKSIAKVGGLKRAMSLTPKRRREIAKAAVKARWKKWRAKHT